MNLKPRFYNIKRTHKRSRNNPGGGTGGCITEDVFGIRRMRISGHLLDLNGEEEEP
jgi:hypothetical protein